MSIDCDLKDVSLVAAGKLQLRSSWSSDRPDGEFARFEIRLSPEGPFRFVVEGAQTTLVKATRRKVGAATTVEISTDYINLLGGSKRLARYAFCGITKDKNGAEVTVQSRMVKFLP